MILKAPFPWFGGKRKVAEEVWRRFGVVSNYVEPFYGSGAVLLGRPLPVEGNETINDADGFVANFWRAIVGDPEATAAHASNPVNENDLHARHVWLLGQIDTLRARLEGDPHYFDAKIAGWWGCGASLAGSAQASRPERDRGAWWRGSSSTSGTTARASTGSSSTSGTTARASTGSAKCWRIGSSPYPNASATCA